MHYRIDEPDYWQLPDKLKSMAVNAAKVNVKIAIRALGDPDAPGTPAVMTLAFPPGFEIERHAHRGARFEVIVKGSMLVGDGKVLRAGDVMVAGDEEQYGPHVAGPDGCTTVEVFTSLAATHQILLDRVGGWTLVDHLEGRRYDVERKQAAAAE